MKQSVMMDILVSLENLILFMYFLTAYSRSPIPDRHDSRSRGAKDRYQSPMRSGSVPHSPYPQENKIKRSSKRSPSPREDRTHSGEGLSSKQVSESKGQYSQSFKVSFTVLQPTLRAF
ncbi:uncharacterized protein LOC120290394 isoform X1 [Eucalyptus grandis]|uniref:uncharacterized protein LOC120290394 isoform X1 n=1 Tax=Eucalyptus grandis TaxID=71139 RepID=UPI00192EFDFE|nr:uncharacterized protein LOC120290394 isoform X1 [Eucalyptus grandis]